MWLITDRERALIASLGPVLMRRYDDLVRDWAGAWRAATEEPFGDVPPPIDLPAITRVAVEEGLEPATEMQRRAADRAAEAEVPLSLVVLSVLLWEEAVLRRLARDAVEDIFSGAAALNRFFHGLVLFAAEAHAGLIQLGREEVRRELADADRFKHELVSMVSHDLKTPLTTLQAVLGELRSPGLEPDQRSRFLEMASANTDRLARLISTILEVSSIEARTVDLQPHAIDPADTVRRLGEGIMTPVRVSAVADVPRVLADRDALERILLNLIDNAVRFSPQGEAVRVEVVPDGPFVELRVLDRGPGVPEGRREGLFSKFYQVDTSPTGRRTGTGLGLAIVRGLAEAMGGTVGYRPNVPTGSVFWVRLPASRDEEVITR